GLNVDEDRAREELRYITSLPGVMGMKFTRDGTPVLHVRLSHLRNGHRYDMGDMEITFSPRLGNSVVAMVLTRTSMSGNAPLYWGSIRRRDDGAMEGEFCHGSRSEELRLLFNRGDFSQFVHLIMNTLDGINQGHGSNLRDTFTEIPEGCVWRPRV